MASTVSIILDNRESGLKDIFPDWQTSNLELGDVVIKVDNNDVCVIERKTLTDLAASIKDGRYHSQKKRLLERFDRRLIYYIIEGSIDYSLNDVVLNGIPKKTFMSCIINTLVRDDIKLVVTKNIGDTANFIKQVFDRIKETPEKYTAHQIPNQQINNQQAQDPEIKKPVQRSITKESCFINQLCQVPDVSYKTAFAIANRFTNFKSFYIELANITDEEKLKVLKSIYLEEPSGRKRKISEKVVNNIITLML